MSTIAIFLVLVNVWLVSGDNHIKFENTLKTYKVLPDVLKNATNVEKLQIYYADGIAVQTAEELSPWSTRNLPINIKWTADENRYYIIVLIDPDAPKPDDPSERSWQHWVICNVPGTDYCHGETVTEYVGPAPPWHYGIHRYVLMVFLQSEYLTDKPEFISKTNPNRENFSIENFANYYKLGQPIAVNFFLERYDKYVDVIQSQLSPSST